MRRRLPGIALKHELKITACRLSQSPWPVATITASSTHQTLPIDPSLTELPYAMGLIAPATSSDGDGRGWYRELTRYHWFVFTVAALGWMFDCLDQQLFNLARAPAMKELLANDPGTDLNRY